MALQPGVAVFEEYTERGDGTLKLAGGQATQFLKLPEFQRVTLRLLRREKREPRRVIKERRGREQAAPVSLRSLRSFVAQLLRSG